SDEWLKTSELGDGDLDIEDIFPKEHTAFYDTNKVGTSSAFTLKEWNTQKGVVHLSHDPTFIVTTDHHSVRSHETNQRPFLVTSDAAEVVRFLESHK
ncbi:MAG: hypothetical protein ACI35O_01980, partial [Bacillaceae bacterium]